MKTGDVALGMPVRLGRSGDIERIAKSTGHDFILIDCQHSLFNLEIFGEITSTAMSCGIAPLVRMALTIPMCCSYRFGISKSSRRRPSLGKGQ